MEALRAGLDGTPVVLIQGPPGTGKTRTILNLLSVVMHSAQKGSLELMRVGACLSVLCASNDCGCACMSRPYSIHAYIL
jgi:senataxin